MPNWTRRDFVRTAVAAASLANPLTAFVSEVAAATRKPNVIFMMADDLGYGDVGFNGNSLVKTPDLDAMARAGIRFTRFYSVGPVCSPTRACVQTGRHCSRFGMSNVNTGKLPSGEINIAQVAKSKGYTTGHFGKWHLGTFTGDPKMAGPAAHSAAERIGPPWKRHYDNTFSTVTNIATWDPLDETGLQMPKHRCHFWSNGKLIKEKWRGSSEKIIVDRALDFFSEAAARTQPFMATIWFYGPHSPVRAGKGLRDLYPNQPLGRQHYLGAITSIDIEVGRIRRALQKLGIEDNTLIFFCSDNGPEGSGRPPRQYDPYHGAFYGSAGGFRGRKRYLYNGGVCVPAFAFWPGVIKGAGTVDEPVCALDYLPTLADMLDYRMPDARPIDGTSILPLLEGRDWKREKFIPFASSLRRNSPTASIIDRGHKLMLWLGTKRAPELYDVHNDPGEETNLARQKPELTAELEQKLMTWLRSARHSFEKGDYPGYRKQGQFVKGAP